MSVDKPAAQAAPIPEEELDWYSTGYEEMDTIPDREDFRFRCMSRDTEFVVFIDGDGPEDAQRFQGASPAPFCIWEYEIPIIGDDGKPKWGNTVTSLRGRKTADGRPVEDYVRTLAPDLSPSYMGFYSVAKITDVWDDFLDEEEGGRDEEGGRRRRRRRRGRRDEQDSLPLRLLLAVKKKMLKFLRDASNQYNGLRGTVWEVYRTKKWASRYGDEWHYVTKLDEGALKRLLGNLDQPWDYRQVLAPKSREEIEMLVERRVPREELEDRDERRGRGRGRGRDRGRGRGRDDYDDDDDRRGRRRGRGRYDEDSDDDRGGARRGRRRDTDEDYEDEPRGRRRSRSDEDSRGDEPRSRGRSDDDESSRYDDEEEERPPRRYNDRERRPARSRRDERPAEPLSSEDDIAF